MMWLIHFVIAWLMQAQSINLIFAALSLAAALGANPRTVMVITAVLYFLLCLI